MLLKCSALNVPWTWLIDLVEQCNSTVYMLSAQRPWTWLLFERKLLCCVNPVARESKAHYRNGDMRYKSNAHRSGGV